ncbi:3'-5' exonuclease [Deinococcus peraridilitoris]|nr:3'-5' exonuclease [Deinococcus peraridilitoris]
MEYVVFDLETTGLSPEKDAIIEIGAMYVRDGELIEAPLFHALVNPEREIPWYASRVHGIRNAHVAGAPKLAEVLPAFLDFVGDRAVVAHNIGFDAGFMRMATRRHGLLWTPREEICTVQLSRRAFPRERSHKLDLLASRFGLSFEEGGRHRSLGDVRVTAQAFLALQAQLGLHVHNAR